MYSVNNSFPLESMLRLIWVCFKAYQSFLTHPGSPVYCLSSCFEIWLEDTQVELFLPLSACNAILLWYLWSTQEGKKLPWEVPSLQHSRGTPWAGGGTEKGMEIPAFLPSGTVCLTSTHVLAGSIIKRLLRDIWHRIIHIQEVGINS